MQQAQARQGHLGAAAHEGAFEAAPLRAGEALAPTVAAATFGVLTPPPASTTKEQS